MSDQQPKTNFWISYSDLATGLMIIFMVVMLLFIVISKINEEQAQVEKENLIEQQEEYKRKVQTKQEILNEITRKLQVILGTKPDFAESIQEALREAQDERLKQLQLDAVTAQLEIQDDVLNFEINSHVLKPEGQSFLREFTPNYICALWLHESAPQRGEMNEKTAYRLDPERTGAVRRILVTGSADLKGSYKRNHELSAERAEAVVQFMAAQLQCLASPEECTDFRFQGSAYPPTSPCADKGEAVWRYARERLWAVGAGDTQHCASSLARSDAESCEAIPDEARSEQRFRRVSFELEVTGDDMTGFLLHVLQLMKTLLDDPSGGVNSTVQEDLPAEVMLLSETARLVSQKCWTAPDAYHGCKDFIHHCLGAGRNEENTKETDQLSTVLISVCKGYWNGIEQGNEELINISRKLCTQPGELPGCNTPEME